MTSTSQTPNERSLNNQLVIEEDEYTSALSQIIARDFFPSLQHLDATNDYLDALHSHDPGNIQASVRRLEDLDSFQTPFLNEPFDTPTSGRGDGPRPSKRARYDTSLSLDEFQARYTSEDNASFTEILDQENKERKERWGWAWEAEKRVNNQRDRMIERRERMLIEAPPVTGIREKFRIEVPAPAGLITDGKESEELVDESKNAPEEECTDLVLVQSEAKEEEEIQDVMAPQKDKRLAGVDGWKFKARNSLMFTPDADESPYHVKSGDPGPKSLKSVVYQGTRLPEQGTSSDSISEPPSPTRSRVDAAILGTPYHPQPKVNNYAYVPNLPSPTPASLGPAAVKQLMTLGTLGATPRVISGDDSLSFPSTPFHISSPSAREEMSLRLSNNASKSLRAKAISLSGSRITASKRGLGDMGPPPSTPRKTEAVGNLTPAAKRLLNRTTMGTVASRRAEAMERASGWSSTTSKQQDLNRVRWTPTPNSVR